MCDNVSANDNHCSPTQLERFLAGQSHAEEVEVIELHLDTCLSCREAIEEQAAESAYWNSAFRSLDTRFDGAIETSRLSIQSGLGDVRHGTAYESYLHEWLGPSHQPGSWGAVDQYIIQGVVGVGGMGIVLRAFDPQRNRTVSIKTLRPELAASVEAQQRFAREAKLAASVRHRNIIPIFEIGSWRGVNYLVMPLIETGSLRDVAKSQTLSFDEVIEIARQVSQGLAAAHDRGMVHRDIKPSNILCPANFAPILIADFGLARVHGDDRFTVTGTLNGTPEFMSPEQAKGGQVDTRSDLFSFGSLLYWMVAGESPFAAENHFAVLSKISECRYARPSEVCPRIPAWFDSLVAMLLTKDPEERSVDARQFGQLLCDVAAHRSDPQRTPLPSRLLPRRDPSWRKRLAVGVGIASISGFATCLPFAYEQTEAVSPQSPGGSQAVTIQSDPVNTGPANTGPVNVVPARGGPLDELDRLNMMTDFQAGERLDYWLSRLSNLPSGQIPAESIPLIERIVVIENATVSKLAESVLSKNPFESIDSENPFIPID